MTREQRVRALRRAIESEADSWVDTMTREMAAQGRPVAGGWPGTLSEARARVARCAAGRPDLRVTRDEIDELARQAYVFAKKAWLLRAGPTPNDG